MSDRDATQTDASRGSEDAGVRRRALLAIAGILVALLPLAVIVRADEDQPAKFDDPALNRGVGRMLTAVKRAELIFVGAVRSLGPPPRVKSGRVKALQTVTYRVQDVLKGQLEDTAKEVIIHHVVVGRSRTGHPGPDKNELSPTLFQLGSVLVVMASRERIDGMVWVSVDEDVGTFPATAQNLDAIKKLLAGP